MPSQLFLNAVAIVGLMAVGDAAAQAVEMLFSERKKEKHYADSEEFQPQQYCGARTGRVAASGIFSALAMTLFYAALELHVPGMAPMSLLVKALIDNVLFCPFYYAGMLAINTIFADGDLREVMQHDFVPILKVNFLVFFPFDLIAYTLIPSVFRIKAYSGVCLAFNPLYSHFANRRLDLEFKETVLLGSTATSGNGSKGGADDWNGGIVFLAHTVREMIGFSQVTGMTGISRNTNQVRACNMEFCDSPLSVV